MAHDAPPGRERWVAIEFAFPDNPKILKVGAVGGWVHLCAIIYCAQHRTNGFIPDEAAWRIIHSDPWVNDADDAIREAAGSGKTLAKSGLLDEMCLANLWQPVANGFQIHDYLKHQLAAESIEGKRARLSRIRAEAGRRGGHAKAKKQAGKRPSKTWQTLANASKEEEEDIETPLPAPAPEASYVEPAPDTTRNGAGAGAADDLERIDPATILARVLAEGTE